MRALSLFFIILFCLKSSLAANLSIVISSKNLTKSLSKEEIEDLFLGRNFTFPNGKKARIIVKSESSPDHKIFTEQFLGKSMSAFKSHWARLIFTGRGTPPTVVNSDDQVKNLIADDSNSIGYISTSSLTSDLKEIAFIKNEPEASLQN